MNKMARVIRPEFAPGSRTLAISDIHGNLPFFRSVLDKICFSFTDNLVLVGDLFEKGDDSLALLRYVMELGRTHHVYSLCGNCDDIDRAFLENRPNIDEKLWPVFRYWKGHNLILQLGAELGLRPERPEDLPALRSAILRERPAEAEFLHTMPHILTAGRYIFVHGGIPREDGLDGLEAYPCMKNDDFLGQGLSFDRWVVVGHWPVTLYRTDIPSAAPLIDRRRHIISIDGGCVLKVDGQLNALIVPDVDRNDFTWTAYDGLPTVTALAHQDPSADSLNIRWSDSAVEVLREEGDCCWCRHLSTGRELWILKEYIYPRQSDGHLHCEDSTDYCLPVEPGDRLSLVRRCSRGILAKKNGVTGWYFGPTAEDKNK